MGRRLPRTGVWLAGCVVAVALVCVCVPASSSAKFRLLSSDVGDQDPCASTGENGGVLIKHNISKESPKPVNVALQCSPLMVIPFGTLSADLLVLRNAPLTKEDREADAPFFRGDVNVEAIRPPEHRWRNTVGLPYIHGDIAENLRLQQFENQPAIRDAIAGAIGSATTSIVAAIVACAIGGIPTLGVTCASVPVAIGVAALAAVGGAIASVISNLVKSQISRISAMADADWFIWSDTKVIWNSFGDIRDTWINPSITNFNPNPFRKDHIRIGVEYSNVPVGGGPDFFDATPSAVKSGTRDDVRQTTDPAGGPADNVIMAAAGNRTVYGGPGRNIIYAGRGNQVIEGGPRINTIVGGAGFDILKGGPGTDTIVDVTGKALVLTGGDNGPGRDYVFVRDGRGGDTVICGSRRSTVVADANDTVIGCGQVITTGPTLRLRSPRTP